MSEFELIRQIQRQTSTPATGVKLGIGDDAALLDVPAGCLLVAATDTLNASVHFPDDTSPFDIGYKCLAVNLSDLAAMGAKPHWALLSLSLPAADSDWLESFTAGFRSLAQVHQVALVGGDTTCGPLSINVTAMGVVKMGRQMLRCGARPGELIVVSGALGGAARVLELLQAGKQVGTRQRLDRPQPRIALGLALAGYASACIDISDGLLADLRHLLRASQCGALINLGSLPADPVLDALDHEHRWSYQLAGGDDYELLFTLPVKHRPTLAPLAKSLAVNLSVIGTVQAGNHLRCVDPDGHEVEPRTTGYEHFRDHAGHVTQMDK